MFSAGALWGSFSRNWRAYLHNLLIENEKKRVDYETKNWFLQESENFIVKYDKDKYDKDGSEIAPLIIEFAESILLEVNEILSYKNTGKILVIIHPDKNSICRNFGWDSSENVMGVYWKGVIRILSPSQWIDKDDKEIVIESFKKDGPMVHEYAHLVVDYKTLGNYPRWLTEGIAQMVEKDVTGFQFDFNCSSENWYSIREMEEGFDKLPDQALAYRQSLALAQYLAEEYHGCIFEDIFESLRRGKRMDQIFESDLGTTREVFERDFAKWTSDLGVYRKCK